MLHWHGIGRFQKISMTIHVHGWLFGILRVRGVLWTGNPKTMGGTYNWNSEGMGGGFRSGISTGERWESIPWKRLFYWLNQSANKARTDNTADGHGRQASIDQWCFHMVFICKGKPTKSGFYIKLQKNMLQNILFFLSRKQPHKLFCPFDAKHGLLTEDAISNFKPWRLKFKMAEIKIYILVISSECANVHHKIF